MRRFAALTAAASVAAVVALLLTDGVREVIAYELIVFWLVATAFIAIAPLRPTPSRPRSTQPTVASRGRRPPQLERLEWMVEYAITSVSDSEARLIPELREVAAMRLRDRHGVDLHRDPDRAAAAIGGAAWPYLDPERPREALTTAQVDMLLTTIEEL